MFTTTVTASSRSNNLRRVFVSFPLVAEGGYHFEMTSFRGGPVELYRRDSDGIYIYQGSVRAYAPGDELRDAFRAAWYAEQPSKAARDAFEKSASERF